MCFAESEESEIQLVASLARSGLSDAMVTKLLAGLPRPVGELPKHLAYSPILGWVVPAPLRADLGAWETEQFIDDAIAAAVESGNAGTLLDWIERMREAIKAIELGTPEGHTPEGE